MIAGASEAPIVGPYYTLFATAGAMTRRTEDPSTAMRPFDRDRSGFIVGEGAAFMVLEELSHAVRRGARIYCEWLGNGQSCDAHSSVALHPEGRGIRRAMDRAFLEANLGPSAIDYINAHGSATATNDVIETNAIKAVFGDSAKRVAISATKPVTGHLMGATAAVEAAICALSLYHQAIPPTRNHTNPADGCDLDYVAGKARQWPVRKTMNLNVGFGGKSSALIFGHYDNV